MKRKSYIPIIIATTALPYLVKRMVCFNQIYLAVSMTKLVSFIPRMRRLY